MDTPPEVPTIEVPAAFDALFMIVPLLFVAAVVFAVVVGARNFRTARARGIDPLTAQTELTARLLESEALRPAQPTAPERSVEDRLRELDDLHARGVITAEERAEARRSALRG